LAISSGDNRIRIWDPYSSAEESRTRNISRKDVELAWAELGSDDPVKGYRAMCNLVHAPEHSVPFLSERSQRLSQVDPQRIAQLVSKLDDGRFDVRRKATEDLEELGGLAEPALRKRLAEEPAPEVRRRAEGLLKKLESPVTSAGRLRVLRAVEVLEHIGTPEARKVLQSLSQGMLGTDLTEGARAALERLAKRPNAGESR